MTYHSPPHPLHLELSSLATQNQSSDFSSSGSQIAGEPNLPIMYTVLEASVAVSAIFGNLLVIVVFLQDRRLRKVTNFYIISLSIADLLVGAIGVPSAILTRIGMPRNSIRLCLTMLSLLMVLCTISILNLVAVSLDRYWAILHPLDYHKRISEKTALVIICVCWILGTAIGFLPLFGWNNGHLASDACFFIPIMNYDYLMFLYFVTIVLPAVIMAFFYIRIYIVVVQQLSLNKVRQLNSSEFTLGKMRSSKPPIFDGLSSSGQYSRKCMAVKLSSQALPSQSSVRRFKSFKSASSPQQLNEIDPNVDISPELTDGDSFGSVSFSPLRHLSPLNSASNNHRSSHQVLNQSEAKQTKLKSPRWRSLWSMRSSSESYLPEENYIEKKAPISGSLLSSFYRTANNGANRMSYSRREVKKAQKLFVIVVFFMLCWLPLYTSNTIQAFCHHCPTPSSSWLDFLIILSHINSAGSPFLYAFHMKDFRQALRRLICKGAINKRKLRDLRREELFSITRSGRYRNGTISVGQVDPSEPMPKSMSEYINTHKRHPCSLSPNSLNTFANVEDKSKVPREEQYRVSRFASTQNSTAPKYCVKVEMDLKEASSSQT